MKKKSWLFAVIAILFFLFFYTRKKKPTPQFYNGFATLKINGTTFESLSGAVKTKGADSTYYLSIETRNVVISKSITLSIAYVSNQRQQQILMKRNPDEQSYPQTSLSIMDGKVLYSYYVLNEEDTLQDYLQFIHLDELTGKTKGRFEASFSIDSFTNLDPQAPDTIHITKGYFETTLFE